MSYNYGGTSLCITCVEATIPMQIAGLDHQMRWHSTVRFLLPVALGWFPLSPLHAGDFCKNAYAAQLYLVIQACSLHWNGSFRRFVQVTLARTESQENLWFSVFLEGVKSWEGQESRDRELKEEWKETGKKRVGKCRMKSVKKYRGQGSKELHWKPLVTLTFLGLHIVPKRESRCAETRWVWNHPENDLWNDPRLGDR